MRHARLRLRPVPRKVYTGKKPGIQPGGDSSGYTNLGTALAPVDGQRQRAGPDERATTGISHLALGGRGRQPATTRVASRL